MNGQESARYSSRVKECTDTRFLPERFRKLSLAQVGARIEQLKSSIGE